LQKPMLHQWKPFLWSRWEGSCTPQRGLTFIKWTVNNEGPPYIFLFSNQTITYCQPTVFSTTIIRGTKTKFMHLSDLQSQWDLFKVGGVSRDVTRMFRIYVYTEIKYITLVV
jgi:hypothetical protein